MQAASHVACQIKYKFGHHFSIMQFGSPTAQIPLESGSSADKRFRADLKILIRTVSYTSHKQMYKVNDDGFIKPFEASRLVFDPLARAVQRLAVDP